MSSILLFLNIFTLFSKKGITFLLMKAMSFYKNDGIINLKLSHQTNAIKKSWDEAMILNKLMDFFG